MLFRRQLSALPQVKSDLVDLVSSSEENTGAIDRYTYTIVRVIYVTYSPMHDILERFQLR